MHNPGIQKTILKFFSTTKAVDVWAYGVLLIRLFTLSWPYPHATTVHDLTIHVARNELRPKDVNSRDLPHPELKDVIYVLGSSH